MYDDKLASDHGHLAQGAQVYRQRSTTCPHQAEGDGWSDWALCITVSRLVVFTTGGCLTSSILGIGSKLIRTESKICLVVGFRGSKLDLAIIF